MKKFLIIAAIISVIAVFQGCHYDKADIVYPKTTCDTTNITYATSIHSILEANCYRCHSGTAEASGGIGLDNLSLLKLEAANGELLGRITSTDPSVMMPQGGPRLTDCDINKIK